MCAGFLGGQKKELESLQLELHVVLSHLIWVLGINLGHLVPKPSLQPLTLCVEISLLTMDSISLCHMSLDGVKPLTSPSYFVLGSHLILSVSAPS